MIALGIRLPMTYPGLGFSETRGRDIKIYCSTQITTTIQKTEVQIESFFSIFINLYLNVVKRFEHQYNHMLQTI